MQACKRSGTASKIRISFSRKARSAGTTIITVFDSADEEICYEVSDEVLEAAAGTYMNAQSIMGGCCYLGSISNALLE